MPTSHEVRYVDVAVPLLLFGAKFTKSALNAGNIVPNPAPRNSAVAKNMYVLISGFHNMKYSQNEKMKKEIDTTKSPNVMTFVILPLSTCLPEKRREIAIPIAIRVKNIPVPRLIPISFAYTATNVVVIPYGIDNNNSAIPAGIPLTKTNLSKEIGSLFIDGFTSVFTRSAEINPNAHEDRAVIKMVLKE